MSTAAVTRSSERLAVASRIVAAALGGYAFTTVVGVFLIRVLPWPRAEAVLAMTLASFTLYTATIVWVFAARSARAAWLGLVLPIAVCGAISWLIGSPA